jgi:integrase
VHDLRRTVATGLARLGCPRVVQDRILNHVDSSVSAIYDRYRYDAEARAWLQKWADHMDALTTRNVVPLSNARAA